MSSATLRHDLNQVSGDVDSKEAKRLLSRTQYRLSHFETGSGEVRYGIQTGLYSDDSGIWPLSHNYAPVEQRNESSHKRRHDRNDWILDLLLIFVVLGLFGVVFAYHKVGGHSGFNDFFNSGNFGPAFVVTLAATIIATLWKRTEISMTVMAPYQRLAKRPSSAESTVLFEATTTPLISTIQAFHHRYFMLGTITIVTLLADLALNVVIGGVPYAKGESLRQSRVSAWLSISILTIMFFTSVVMLVSRFRSSRIPRRPDTLGVVMTYLAGGHLPYAFGVTEYVSDDEWDSAVRSQGKMYRLQEMRRENGTYPWTIDEVENHPKYYE